MMNSEERKAFAASIKPEVKGQSDKFSWRVYQRALLKGRERVYIMTWHPITGDPISADLEQLKAGDYSQMSRIMLGETIFEDGWFHGAKLQSIIRKGMQKVGGSFAFGSGFNTSSWLDITDWFWSEYLVKGRCIFSPLSHAWVSINKNARKCQWCQQHQRRTVVTQKTITRKEHWS